MRCAISGHPATPLPEVPQHVIQRSNTRQPVFFHADAYRVSLADLQDAAVPSHSAVHVYVLRHGRLSGPF
jgi:hypothetical protein